MKKKKKKILYIGNKLTKHGKNPTGVEFIGKMLSNSFEVYSFSNKLNPISRFIDIVLKTIKFAPRVDFVLIDCYSRSYFYIVVAVAFLSKAFRTKYIPILHGGELANRVKKNPILGKFVFGGSFMNVAPSNYLYSKFEEMNFKVLSIPNVLPIEKYNFKLRENYGPKLLFVRSFHEIYNPQLAVNVLAELIKRYDDVELCMVGPDTDGTKNICENLAIDLGIQDRVKFTGKLAKHEWISLSEKYDLFINPTNFDNTPVSVMEAMALGLAIVSTNATGLPYLLKHENVALLSPVKDVSAMVNSVVRYVENQDFTKKIVNNAREQVEKYDENIVLSQWETLLK